MIWIFVLAITGVLAAWLNPIQRLELSNGSHKIIIKKYAWLLLAIICIATYFSASQSSNAEAQANSIRNTTLDIVLRDLKLNKWKAERNVEIANLIDMTNERYLFDEEWNSIGEPADSLSVASFQNQYRVAIESLAKLTTNWKSLGFADTTLLPLIQKAQNLSIVKRVIDRYIEILGKNKKDREFILQMYHDRLANLSESLRICASVTLEYEYSRRLSEGMRINSKYIH